MGDKYYERYAFGICDTFFQSQLMRNIHRTDYCYTSYRSKSHGSFIMYNCESQQEQLIPQNKSWGKLYQPFW